MDYDIYGKRFDEVRKLGLKAPEKVIGQITANNAIAARIGATDTINRKKLPVMITRIKEVKNDKKNS